MRTIEMDNTFMMQLPNSDYEFRDENGNVIESKKIVLEKKPKWPTSSGECYEKKIKPEGDRSYFGLGCQ